MNNILITGASGNIGSQIVKILKEKNIDFTAGVHQKQLDDVKSVVINFNDKENLVKNFRGIDTLFLLYPMGEKTIEWNKNAIDAAKIAGVKHIIRSSGKGSDINSTYLMPKVQGTIDKYIIDSGIDYTITQPASFMQNLATRMAPLIKKGIIYQPVKADAKFNWVDVRDIAAVSAEIVINPTKYRNQILVISGNENLTYPEALNIISKAIDKPVNYVSVSDEAAIEAMKGNNMPQYYIDMIMSLNKIINNGDAVYITDTVKKVTGKEPISFNSFVADYKETWI